MQFGLLTLAATWWAETYHPTALSAEALASKHGRQSPAGRSDPEGFHTLLSAPGLARCRLSALIRGSFSFSAFGACLSGAC